MPALTFVGDTLARTDVDIELGLAARGVSVAIASQPGDGAWLALAPHPTASREPLNGPIVSNLWKRRRRLMVAGLDTPVATPVRDVERGVRAATRLGFPIVLRTAPAYGPLLCTGEATLRATWTAERHLVEEYFWEGSLCYHVSVIDGRAIEAIAIVACDGFRTTAQSPRYPVALDFKLAACATRAARALRARVAVVEIIRTREHDLVLDVRQTRLRLGQAGLDALADLVSRDACAVPPTPRPPTRPAPRPIEVAITCHDPRARRPVWLWCSLAQAFQRRGDTVRYVERGDTQSLERADFVLLDPGRTYRASGRDGEWLNYIHDHHASRAHYAKRCEGHRLVSVTDKSACALMSRELALPHPTTVIAGEAPPCSFPLIAKPLRSSCGRGLRWLLDSEQLASFAPHGRVPRGYVLQAWIEGPTPWPASLRIITVRDRIVAAAVFHHPSGRTSNLSRGGRAIPLTGRNGQVHIAAIDSRILAGLGIPDTNRDVPAEAATLALRASRWLAARGCQIVGHDLLLDSTGRWLYLEANAYPGYLVFAATDGDRRRRLLSGYYRAGALLADALARELANNSRA